MLRKPELSAGLMGLLARMQTLPTFTLGLLLSESHYFWGKILSHSKGFSMHYVVISNQMGISKFSRIGKRQNFFTTNAKNLSHCFGWTPCLNRFEISQSSQKFGWTISMLTDSDCYLYLMHAVGLCNCQVIFLILCSQ